MFLISEQQRNDVLEYLTTRPWREVNNLVVALMKLEQQQQPSEGDGGVEQ